MGVGMQRPREKVIRRRLLDHPAPIHDRHTVGCPGDDAEIMRDESDADPKFASQSIQYRDHLRLNRYIERCRWLVRDENRWIIGDRHCDHRSLTHAARELMRILSRSPARLGNRDDIKELRDAFADSARIQLRAMQTYRFRNLLADRQYGIECTEWILENHRDPIAA